jgi:molybdopterin converting factor small subunit
MVVRMSVTLLLPSVLTPHAGGAYTVTTRGASLAEVVDEVTGRYPELGLRLRDAHGEIYPHVNLYINDEDARFLGGFSAPLRDGDVVTVVPAVAGG